MRAVQRPFASLLQPARLIWLLALALALQPMAWARQPTAQWVALPYCATSAAPTGTAASSALTGQAATPRGAHRLLVLLNPAAALSAVAAQVTLPTAPGGVMALAATRRHRADPAAAAGPAATLLILLRSAAPATASRISACQRAGKPN